MLKVNFRSLNVYKNSKIKKSDACMTAYAILYKKTHISGIKFNCNYQLSHNLSFFFFYSYFSTEDFHWLKCLLYMYIYIFFLQRKLDI